ncbi:MAG TPA: hypothetical protein VFE62_10730 [Gemmataceae bacterium]|nr:hypothetical protein [Gemmataceae bacterium]
MPAAAAVSQVIPKDGTHSANLLAGPLNTAIRQAGIMSEDDGRVDLRFAKQRLSVKARSPASRTSSFPSITPARKAKWRSIRAT